MLKTQFKVVENRREDRGQDARATTLFAPLQLGSLQLDNRIVMAPMTRNRAGEGNAPTELNALYYRQRASAGLIVTEGSQVSEQGVGYPATPGIHSARQLAGWREVTRAVHDEGGRIFLQLWHVGRISHPSLQPGGERPVAPSAIRPDGEAHTYEGTKPFETPRALETSEIAGVVAQFERAAGLARQAGFDGVEIHAANGYLIDQFLRDGTNRRTDSYGGSAARRVRLLAEVTEAVAGQWPAGRVGVRLSPLSHFNDMSDSDPRATFRQAARTLSGLPLAYLHVVEQVDPEAGHGFDLDELREEFSGVYMVNGGYDRGRAADALAGGRAVLVSFGRPFLANPDLPERLLRDASLNEPDPSTFYGGDERGYVDYPFLGGTGIPGRDFPGRARA